MFDTNGCLRYVCISSFFYFLCFSYLKMTCGYVPICYTYFIGTIIYVNIKFGEDIFSV